MNFTNVFMILAVIISVVISIVVYCFIPSYNIKGFDKALEGILLFSSITLGFYGACLGVLASIFNTKVVKEVMKDSVYRQEFLLISGVTLLMGFLTVVTTIVYQVMFENKGIPEIFLRITNTLWSGFVVLYLCLTILFVFVTFITFLSNTDSDQQTRVHDGKVGNPDF